MSSTNHTHGQPRTSVPNVRKTAVRAARSVPSVKTTGGSKVTFKVAKNKFSKDEEEELDEDKDDMATSFLQFWFVVNLKFSPLCTIYGSDPTLAPCARSK